MCTIGIFDPAGEAENIAQTRKKKRSISLLPTVQPATVTYVR